MTPQTSPDRRRRRACGLGPAPLSGRSFYGAYTGRHPWRMAPLNRLDKPISRNPFRSKMPWFGARTPAELRGKGVVAVLGMHRSGTSAVAGMLADHGVELGPVSEQNRFNPRGNREIRELNRLHDRVLERSGGSWWEPPARIRARPSDYRRRNEILRLDPRRDDRGQGPAALALAGALARPRPEADRRDPEPGRRARITRAARARAPQAPSAALRGGMGRALADLQPRAARRAPPETRFR